MWKEIDEYIVYMKDKRKSSENTIQAYERDLKKFIRYLESSKLKGFDQVDNFILKEYMEGLVKEGKKPTTISRNIAVVKSFFDYLMQKEKIKLNPAISLKAPHINKKNPYVLTEEQISLLLQQPEESSPKGKRDRAMLEILYATGVRVSELIALKLDDLNLELGYIVCRHEGKERLIPLGKMAKKVLEVYLESGRKKLLHAKETGLLFVNCTGEPLSRQGFWKIVTNYGKQAGFQEQITPHTLRHSFSMHLLKNGVDLKSVKELLGYGEAGTAQMNTGHGNSGLEMYHGFHL